MKITVLMGSPNRNGSTSLLVNEFVRGADEVGHICDVIDVWLLRLSRRHGAFVSYD